MKKKTQTWLLIAAFLLLIGCALFVCVMSILKWDFTKLSTAKYETNTYEVGEEFDAISIDTDTADIVFALSDDGKCRVECYEDEKTKHSVTVENHTLVVGTDPKAWYDYIGLGFRSPKITVYLPSTEYTSLLMDESTGDIEIPKEFHFNNVDISSSTGHVHFYASASGTVKVKTSTGHIRVENCSAGALDLEVSTGRVTVSGVTCKGNITIGVSTGKTYLQDITCKSVVSHGSTGNMDLNHVIAAEKFSIERSTGNVKFDGSDAPEIFVKTDTGDVTGSLLTDKVFLTQTDTGNVDVPKTAGGGRCEIITDTGNIRITIASSRNGQ